MINKVTTDILVRTFWWIQALISIGHIYPGVELLDCKVDINLLLVDIV